MIKEIVYFNLLFKHCEPGKEVMSQVGKTDEGVALCGALGVDNVAFDV